MRTFQSYGQLLELDFPRVSLEYHGELWSRMASDAYSQKTIVTCLNRTVGNVTLPLPLARSITPMDEASIVLRRKNKSVAFEHGRSLA